MIDYDRFDPLSYVTAAAPLLGLSLSAEKLKTVAEAFALVIKIAQPALDADVSAEIEPAPVFRARGHH